MISTVTPSGPVAKTLTLQGSYTGISTISGAIVDNSPANVTGVAVNTSGTWALSNSGNSFTGPVDVQQGTLAVTALTDSANPITFGSVGNATLQWKGPTATLNRPIALPNKNTIGSIDASGTGLLTVASPSLSTGAAASGTKTLGLTGTNTERNNLAVVLFNNPTPLAVLKDGAGTWVLSGSNNYGGGTTINSGTLSLGHVNGIPYQTAVTMNGGLLDVNGFSPTFKVLNGSEHHRQPQPVVLHAHHRPQQRRHRQHVLRRHPEHGRCDQPRQGRRRPLTLSRQRLKYLRGERDRRPNRHGARQDRRRRCAERRRCVLHRRQCQHVPWRLHHPVQRNKCQLQQPDQPVGGRRHDGCEHQRVPPGVDGQQSEVGRHCCRHQSKRTPSKTRRGKAAPRTATLTLSITTGGSYTFPGLLQDHGSGGSGKLILAVNDTNGSGRQVLAGTGITYTGGTTINGGTLALSDTTAFATDVTVNRGTLEVDGTTTWAFGRLISGGGTVLKSGSNTVTLVGSNTYTGRQTVIGGGSLSVATLNSVNGGTPLLPSSNLGAPATVASGTIGLGSATAAGTLLYTGPGEITDRMIDLPGTTFGGAIQNDGSGPLVFNAPAFTASGIGAKTLTLQGSNTGANTINSLIVDNATTNPTSVAKAGAGTWTLANANNGFSGGVSINQGTLSVASLGTAGNNSLLGTGGTINIGSGGITGTLLYTGSGEITDKVINLAGATGGAVAVIDQSGSGLLKFTANTTAAATAKTLTLQGSTSGSGEFAGTIANGPNAVKLTKNGTGTWVLSGANTYTGAATINGGTLKLTGSLAATAVTVSGVSPANPILAGTGSIGGTVTVAATGSLGSLVPGDLNSTAPAKLTINGLVANTGAMFDFDLDFGPYGGHDLRPDRRRRRRHHGQRRYGECQSTPRVRCGDLQPVHQRRHRDREQPGAEHGGPAGHLHLCLAVQRRVRH